MLAETCDFVFSSESKPKAKPAPKLKKRETSKNFVKDLPHAFKNEFVFKILCEHDQVRHCSLLASQPPQFRTVVTSTVWKFLANMVSSVACNENCSHGVFGFDAAGSSAGLAQLRGAAVLAGGARVAPAVRVVAVPCAYRGAAAALDERRAQPDDSARSRVRLLARRGTLRLQICTVLCKFESKFGRVER